MNQGLLLGLRMGGRVERVRNEKSTSSDHYLSKIKLLWSSSYPICNNA